MTTAARPTWEPARGGSGRGEKDLSAISKQYSSRDLPSHTKLKQRETGQGTVEELIGKDFKKELEEREKLSRNEKQKDLSSRAKESKDFRTESILQSREKGTKKSKLSQISSNNLDADDPIDEDESEESEDDTSELLAELQRIKQERAAEEARKESERKQEEEKIRVENILSGNPLLSEKYGTSKSDFKIKRRWDDDVVFKNCARGEPDSTQKCFINDALRSEFHKKFMEKYIK